MVEATPPQWGSVWWIDLNEPKGSEPGDRRPAVVVSADPFNRSLISTVVVAMLTSNLRLADMPGNVTLESGEAGLRRATVINVTQLVTIDKSCLSELVGHLGAAAAFELTTGLRQSLQL